jgi:hypothetical protein
MAASSAAASKSGLYADPREDWLALRKEEIIDPQRPIVDPHHHLWDRGGQRYLIEEMAKDIASGHNVIATVYVDCRSMYRAHRPEALRARRRSRIRQLRRRDERQRRLWSGRDLRRHCRPRQPEEAPHRHPRGLIPSYTFGRLRLQRSTDSPGNFYVACLT